LDFYPVPVYPSTPDIRYIAQQEDEASDRLEDASIARTVSNRTIEFLTRSNFKTHNEIYGGMWWHSRDLFLLTSFDTITMLEHASLNAFIRHGGSTRLTRDWLDFSVEHLSKYVRHLMRDTHPVTKQRVADLLAAYIRRTIHYDMSSLDDLAMNSTIAVVPFRATYGDNQMLVLQMAATLVSLWKIGIQRILVVGLSDNEEKVSNVAFDILHDHTSLQTIELAYVTYPNATRRDRIMVPRIALTGLQAVMRQSLGQNATINLDVQAWLGANPTRWKYVYFTEPDLILHTRPSALSAITQVLNDGKLVVAHRLEPLPHYRNFPDMTNNTIRQVMNQKLLPDYGVFSAIHEVDLANGDVCCDGGRYYPANRKHPQTPEQVRKTRQCKVIWPHCGFSQSEKNYEDPAIILESHSRLLGYPLFTIKDGTGFPLVGANQRVCVPRRGPTDFCHRPIVP